MRTYSYHNAPPRIVNNVLPANLRVRNNLRSNSVMPVLSLHDRYPIVRPHYGEAVARVPGRSELEGLLTPGTCTYMHVATPYYWLSVVTSMH